MLASRIEALFRAVPPSLYLALGMTEKEEKAQRRALMNEYGISELGAAKRAARQMDELRGILRWEGVVRRCLLVWADVTVDLMAH